MNDREKAIIKQIDFALEKAEAAIRKAKGGRYNGLEESLKVETNVFLLSTIERLAHSKSCHVSKAQKTLESGVYNGHNIPMLKGILKALRTEYEAGYLQNVQELIQADIFADFLEMAEYLLKEGYKDSAAVMIGGVLEEHLRKLCTKNGIDIEKDNGSPKTASAMNSDLYKEEVCSMQDNKSVISWLGFRNNAAHGKYGEYNKQQVSMMLQGVQDFLARHSS